MEIERRERDPDTGEMTPSEASLVGAGFGDVFGKIVAKLTGKTAKKLATKAAEKLVEKGAEKVGEKTGQLVGEKIYDKFSTKRAEFPPGPGPRRANASRIPQRSAAKRTRREPTPRNKRKRNWEIASCCEQTSLFIPSCRKKQISKDK